MRNLVWLAWKYVAFHRWKTAVSSFAVALCVFTPLAVELVVAEFERSLSNRSMATPLVVGSKGSRFDLAFHAMHFETVPPTTCTMKDWQTVFDSKMRFAIPIHCHFRASGFPVVGTNLDYWDFRGLKIAQGTNLKRLGDCVLGATVAEQLGLAVHDRLLSDSESAFDLVGTYPLQMRVVGILESTESPDDNGVFVDVKTSWIIAGLGHGHESMESTDASNVLERSTNQIVAAESLVHFNRITDLNESQFHFHGDLQDLPLTAIIAVPSNERSETILEGKFVDPQSHSQVVRPVEVFAELMTIVVQMKELIQLVGSLLIVTTLLYFMVVIALNRKIRAEEFATMHKLGCAPGFILRLQFLELAVVVSIGTCVAAAMLIATNAIAPALVSRWI
jgi:putative ABC transport system permease protein